MTNAETSANTTPKTTRSRRPLVIMLLVATLPVIGAYFVYFTGIGMPDNTVNAGKFVRPALSLENLVGEEVWQDFQADKKWRLLIPISENCDQACEANLYTSRQVHIRLAQKSERLERYAFPMGQLSEASKAQIQKEHPRLTILDTAQTDVQSWVSELPSELNEDYYLLVDQEGRAMMSYHSRIHGNDVLKDIKRALKYSIDYQ